MIFKPHKFQVGQMVECTDDKNSDWKEGTVLKLNPLEIQPRGWDRAHVWEYVRPIVANFATVDEKSYFNPNIANNIVS